MPIQFFKKQEKIYPRRVWGVFRNLKWAAMLVLLGIYYGAPWLRWDRGPSAPNQAILIDLNHARAYFFGIEIWPQEVYYITGILILSAIGLFFVTSLFGRVWCGYACPQTVWTDLFIWVERFVQGDRNARKKRDDSPWTLDWIWRKSLTHLIWILIGACTGGAWVFYFNDAPTLLQAMWHFDVSSVVLFWILGLTFSTYLMAGFAREQVCTYMCPYARFQSAMFDKQTLIIAYDQDRGEPRGKHKAGDSWEGKGHCVDCSSCVVVCPIGIDIRHGLQMECIACGLCIDACDHVMEKVGLPKGLIRYDTEDKKPFSPWRPRTFWYGGLLTVVGGVMLYSLLNRSALEVNVLHDRNPLFVTLSEGTLRNGYGLTVMNKSPEDRTYHLSVEGLDRSSFHVQSGSQNTGDSLFVAGRQVGHFRVFVTAPRQDHHRKTFFFVLQDKEKTRQHKTQTIFISDQK